MGENLQEKWKSAENVGHTVATNLNKANKISLTALHTQQKPTKFTIDHPNRQEQSEEQVSDCAKRGVGLIFMASDFFRLSRARVPPLTKRSDGPANGTMSV